MSAATPPSRTAPPSGGASYAPAPSLGFRKSLGVIARLFRYSLRYRTRMLLVPISMIAGIAFLIATPELLQWAVDVGLGAEAADGNVSIDPDKVLLVVAFVALLGAAILRGVAGYVQSYYSEWVGQSAAYEIRKDLYHRLQTLSFAYHDEAHTGHVMVRATQDVEAVRMFLGMGGTWLVFSVAILIGIFVMMMLAHIVLALIVAAFMVLILWRSFTISRTTRPIWQDIQEGQARLGNVLQEALTGIRVVKAFSREKHEEEKFGGESAWLYERSLDANKVIAINSPIMSALGLGALAATIWVGGLFVIDGKLSLGELLAFLFYVNMLQMPVRMLGFVVMMVPRAVAAGSRVFELLDEESAIVERESPVTVARPAGAIKFANVSFSYDSRSPVLTNVDFEAAPGEVIALMGRSGSGKTTIVNLIPRFYDVTDGALTFDGVDVRDLGMDFLRKQVAVVQQDVFLFSDTIRENIAYGRPGASEEQIEAAAKLARIHEFIMSQPEGYDTWVGERGATLSGGQKQRVAIARALLMNPRVLVFDDSTSSVDTQTEFEIQHAMSTLMEGRTTFVIAHRLRSVEQADQILVLDEGKIVQRGTHVELLQEGGLYREIYDLELRDREEAFANVAGGSA